MVKKAAPVVRTAQHETNTADLQMQQPPPIVVPELGTVMVREPEALVPAETQALNKEHLDALAFNEDVLIIMLQPSSEENAPMVIDVAVNGEARWVPVGMEVPLKRKFVEVLVRSKPVAVQTLHEEVGAKVINNQIIRNQRAKYPLSVLRDPSPKGGEWLRRIYSER